ncbi:MAG TPA: 30S ribosomal protein S1 [Terracidiphilus sp.]|nr:30S ribosomal protein S1 [Terracidiphilus sp.]
MTEETNPESLPIEDIAPSPAAEPVAEPVAEAAPESATVPIAAPVPVAEPQAVAPAAAPEPVPAPAPVVADEPAPDPVEEEPTESFADMLRDFERSHTHKSEPGAKQLLGTVVSLSADQVFLDIGYKTEGVLPRSGFENNAEGVKPGDTFPVSVTGRNEEHYYELSRFKVAQPRDWSALEAAFAEKLAVVGTVTEVIKGGLSVDIGVRAFMPGSRSGARDAAELEKLVGTQINCRITKLEVTDENVVVDRRVVLEEQARAESATRHAALKEGDIVSGTVRTLMPYGAFVDLGGVDGLLHISDMAHSRVSKPEDILTVGQELQVRILKIDSETKKISLGLKQLQAEPWETAPERLKIGQRVSGAVTRLMDFGAFVEIEPGIEGLIHISEMAWGKKVRHPSDLLKQGERVDAVILSIKPEERRIALGLKQTLADPWLDVQRNFPAGAQIEGPVTKIMNFGAFVQIADGIEGLVHISEIVADRRLNHPSDVLRAGQVVKAQVLAIDAEKRQIKLSMKQLIPTSIDEYIVEQKVGDIVSGRVVELSDKRTTVELGEGIRANCRASAKSAAAAPAAPEAKTAGKPDLSNLSSMLKARWQGNAPDAEAQPEPLAEGQIRSFKIVKIDLDAKKIEVELA